MSSHPELTLRRRVFAARVLTLAALTLPAYMSSARAWQAPEQITQKVAQQTAAAQLTIAGAVSTPITVTAADLKTMPRKTVKVLNEHNQKTEVYEGVLLEALLQKAGAPQGEALRGALMASYVLAGASDGYRVAFSLAELDPGITDSDVLVADALDGAPLGQNEGPFKLVAPHEKRPVRWVRMLKSITVVTPN
jgi:DMSO/TMAO reductase YedYZ molybdopterin-dependent catalytic subunit